MPNQPLITRLKMPRWEWRDSGWWLGAFGAVFAVALFVFPALSGHSLKIRIEISVAWFVGSCVLLLGAAYLFKVCSVVVQRLRAYEQLYSLVEHQKQQIDKSQTVILELSQELTESRKFEIEKTLYYGETLYLVIRQRRGAKLEMGHRLIVIDNQDGGIMGVFEVSEIRSDVCRAVATSDVDPVWMGFIHQGGKAEMSAPPNTVAFLMPKDQNND